MGLFSDTLKFRSDKIWFLGDTHGTGGVYNAAANAPKDVDIVHVGDVGIGFQLTGKDRSDLEIIAKRLKDRGQRMFCIRGNHDKPEWFNNSEEFAPLYLISDYTYAETPNGTKFLLVGGEISIDRCVRTEGRDYWKNEGTVYQPVKEVDVMVFHGAPTDFNNPTWNLANIFPSFAIKDAHMIDDCVAQRKILDRILAESKAKHLYFGHFHNKKAELINGVGGRCVNIDELLEVNFSKFS